MYYFSEKEKEHLEMLYQRGLNNGVPEMEIIDAAENPKEENLILVKKQLQLCMLDTAGITGPLGTCNKTYRKCYGKWC